MKKCTLKVLNIGWLSLSFLFLISCNQKYFDNIVNIQPKKKLIKSSNQKEGVYSNFHEIAIPYSFDGDSIEMGSTNSRKIIIDTGKYFIINKFSSDSILRKMENSHPVLGKIISDNQLKSYEELLSFIYKKNETESFEYKQEILEIKEVITPIMAKEAFWELNFDWGCKGFQYGDSTSQSIVIDLFLNDEYYFLVLKGFSNEELDSFLSLLTEPNVIN